MYLAWTLKRSRAVCGQRRVVGVVGRGHLTGVMQALASDNGGDKLVSLKRPLPLMGSERRHETQPRILKNPRLPKGEARDFLTRKNVKCRKICPKARKPSFHGLDSCLEVKRDNNNYMG